MTAADFKVNENRKKNWWAKKTKLHTVDAMEGAGGEG